MLKSLMSGDKAVHGRGSVMQKFFAASIAALVIASQPAKADLTQFGVAAAAGTFEVSDVTTALFGGVGDGGIGMTSASISHTDALGQASAGVQLDTTSLSIPVLTGGSISSGQNNAAASATVGIQGYTFMPTGPLNPPAVPAPAQDIDLTLNFTGQITPNPSARSIDVGLSETFDVATELRAFVYILDAGNTSLAFPTATTNPLGALAFSVFLAADPFLGTADLSTLTGGLDIGAVDPGTGLAAVTGTAVLSVSLAPDDEIYLVAGLATQAIDGESALSLSTLTFAFDAPTGSLVPAASFVPVPAAWGFFLSAALLLPLVRSRRRRR